MLNKPTDALLLLIQSLNKAEKKNFKLYVTRNSKREHLRTVMLFDVLDKMAEYDEAKVLLRLQHIPRQQLLNIKTRLYSEILASLRIIKEGDHIDIKLREQMDFARILYNKGLYVQSLKVLEKLKEFANTYQQVSYLQQIVSFEKDIEGLHITRSMQGRADQLAAEAHVIAQRLLLINKLSDLSLQLYGWYIAHGHARDDADEQALRSFFETNMPVENEAVSGFYEQLYLHQSYCWFKFILQDFFKYYRHVQHWVGLFDAYPEMKAVEPAHYIKGLHNLASAHFYLRNFKKLDEAIDLMTEIVDSEIVQKNENYLATSFIYLYTAKINKHFMEGTFSEGLLLVPYVETKLLEYKLHFDKHRILVFYYKIACLYFGSGDNEHAITYLNKIINWKTDLRMDLQCYARLLHLIAHYELGNYDLLEYLSKSVYRMMARMGNLSVVEEEIFNFLKLELRSVKVTGEKGLRDLLARLQKHTAQRHETRAYAYLDITSWLESKLYKVPVQSVVRNKYLQLNKHK